MKQAHIIIMALGLSLAAGAAFATGASADDGRRDGRGDRDGWRDHGDRDGWRDRGERHDRGDDHWDRGERWGHRVPVRFVNERRQPVTLFLNGHYIGRVAPFARERIWLPAGHHVVTYKVGWRDRYHQMSVSAFPGQRNRVVIEGRRGWRW